MLKIIAELATMALIFAMGYVAFIFIAIMQVSP